MGLGLGILDSGDLHGLGLGGRLFAHLERGAEDLGSSLAHGCGGGFDGMLGSGLGVEQPCVQAGHVLVDGRALVAPKGDLELFLAFGLVAPHRSGSPVSTVSSYDAS